MKLFFSFAFLFFTTVLFAQAEEGLLQKVKAKLEKVTDYEATGKLKLDVSFINAQESDVTVYFKKPNKIKIKKTGGISILPKGGISVNTASLLPAGGYQTLPGGKATVDGVGTTLVKVVPTDEASDVAISTLYIDEKEAVIRKAVVKTNNTSNSYEVQMTYGKYIAWGLPDKVVFSFDAKDYKLPKGITFEYDKGEKKVAEKDKNKKSTVTITYASYKINKGVSEKDFE